MISGSTHRQDLGKYGHFYLQGLGNTLWVTLLAVSLGVVLGLLVASGRMMKLRSRDNPVLKGIKAVVRFLCTTYVRCCGHAADRAGVRHLLQRHRHRAEPFRRHRHPHDVGIIAVGLNSGAYLSEVIRSGIGAVPGGQRRPRAASARASGKRCSFVILPQAIRNILPALCNEFVTIIKETSVLAMVGIAELMFKAQSISTQTYIFVEPYIIAAAMYFTVVFPLSKLICGGGKEDEQECHKINSSRSRGWKSASSAWRCCAASTSTSTRGTWWP